MLEENLATNTQRAIRVEAQAAAAGSGTVDFFIGSHHHQSSLNADWASGGGPQQKITVPAVALDDYCARLDGFRQIAFIKMDIEGGGVFALGGCSALFRDHRPLGIVESHTPAEDGAISGILTTHEYVGFRVNTRKWITKPKETHPDPEGVWGTVLLVPKERRAKVPW
jgi:FkbM family methyltransferase